MEEQFWRTVEEGDLSELAATLGVSDQDRQQGLHAVVPALAAWRRSRREQGLVDGWRHRVEWRALPAPVPTPAAIDGTWLLVVPEAVEDGDAATAVRAALENRGVRTLTLTVASDDMNREALQAQLNRTDGAGTVTTVLSLLSLDTRPHPERPAVPLGLAGSLALVQALDDARDRGTSVVRDSGAVGVGPHEAPTAPVQAGVWGLGRAAALEHPKRWGGLVDLPAVATLRTLAVLPDVVAAGR